MKKLTSLVVAGVLALGAVTAFAATQAQGGADGKKSCEGKRGGFHKKGLSERAMASLNLTETQRAQIATIRAETREQMAALRQSNVARDQKRAEMRRIAQISRDRTMAVLTPAQKLQLEQMKKQRKDRRAPAGV